MSQSIPAVFENGVFKPLAKVDLPEKQQTYLLIVLSGEDLKAALPPETNGSNSPFDKIHNLVDELKSELSGLSPSDFQFDEAHQKLFLENARSLSPLIPAMIPEEPTAEGEGR